jgi:hypothetical protein
MNDQAIERMPQVDMNSPSDEAEVQKTIGQMSSGKAPGSDAIPSEMYKACGPLLQKLTKLFQSFWTQGTIPQELKDASIIHLYKRKGSLQACDNHRGISLLSIAGKNS